MLPYQKHAWTSHLNKQRDTPTGQSHSVEEVVLGLLVRDMLINSYVKKLFVNDNKCWCIKAEM